MSASFYGAADIPVMMKEFGVPVRFVDGDGIVYDKCAIRDEMDADALGAEAATFSGHMIVVTFKTDDLPGLAADKMLRVQGTDYKVTQVRQSDDGALTRAWCARL